MTKKIIKNNLLVLVLCIISCTFILFGTSYAYISLNTNQRDTNTVQTGALRIGYEDNGNILNLASAYPVSDAVGMATTGYSFKVTNTGTIPLNYNIRILNDDAIIQSDGCSSKLLNLNNIKYSINGGIPVVLGSLSASNYQVSVGTIAPGVSEEHIIRMWVIDTSGNEVLGKHYHGKVLVTGNQTYADATGASIPEPLEGMIPVTYNGSNWVKADTTKKWYDYQTQMWANAVTVTSDKRNILKSSNPGTVIPTADINTMWVWIPKYEYKVETPFGKGGTSAALPGEIEANFKDKTDINPGAGYILHPAFNFGGENLSGFWVGKFETTGTINSPTIKPNESSLRSQNVSSFFTASRAMQNTGNPYGFSNTKGDTHMMKNMEWGAVAYLSQSKYGKYGNPNYTGANKEIYQNKSSSYITGNSNGTPGTDITNSQVAYNIENTGTGASTTGTIYGIYDMSGGAYEYVMGVLADPSGNPRSGYSLGANSGFKGMYTDGTMNISGQDFPNAKYYDLYIGTTGIKGDATNADKTQGWYQDVASFLSNDNPWFIRGDYYNYNTGAGVFDFINRYGNALSIYSVRYVYKP